MSPGRASRPPKCAACNTTDGPLFRTRRLGRYWRMCRPCLHKLPGCCDGCGATLPPHGSGGRVLYFDKLDVTYEVCVPCRQRLPDNYERFGLAFEDEAPLVDARPGDLNPPFIAPLHNNTMSAVKVDHGVPAATITKIANICLEANAWGHTRYVYLTDLEDECKFQGTVRLVAYAEPADALPEHYHHVATVKERSSLTWWYESLLERALEREWARAAKRGLV